MFNMDSKIPKPAFLKKPAGPLSLPGNARLPLSRDLLNLPQANATMFAKRMASPDKPSNGGVLNRAKLRRSRSATDLNRPDFHRPKYMSNLAPIASRSVAINATTVSMMVGSDLIKPLSETNGTRTHLRRSRSACDIAMKSNVSSGSSTNTSSVSGMSSLAGYKRQPPAAAAVRNGVPAKVSKMVTLNPKNAGPAGIATTTLTKPSSQKPAIALTASKKAMVPPIKSILGVKTGSSSGGGGVTVSSTKTTSVNAPKANAVGTKPVGKTMNKRIPPYDYKARFANLTEKHKALVEKHEKLQEEHASREALQELYDDCTRELSNLKNQHTQLQAELRQIRLENEELKQSNVTLTAALQHTETELSKYREKFTVVDRENEELRKQLKELEERTAYLEEENITLQDTNQRNTELLFHANIERKDLHNMVMDLRGNIRVFCRVRPPLPSEANRIECGWKYLDEQSIELIAMDGTNKRMDFSFDHVFHPRTTQQDIFDNVSPLIQSALDGYNVCIFAYGQTGSGKTYTMDGVPDSLGVIPRTVDVIFNAVHDYKCFGWEYEIRVTFLEIYNEVLYDLLDTSGTTKELEIRMANAKNKTEVYVSNIIEQTVESTGRLHQLMNIAKMNRATAATAGNERSSRSHAVTKITLIGTHQDKGETCIGSVNLVDLAGSESPKTSVRMDETKNINRSLSELSNVILALVQRNEHIPYRNSKLTHLLMPSLGGNSKTLMFVNVSPFQDCFMETVKSLRFASQVNSCKMQKVKKNKVLNGSAVM
ncbi:protein claret segregational [Anopheles maculipalpis]|uniref:protein claret segregational n=1 Tax=Anopheles maculipalpis TaxID=1496333 RepID=UPI002159850D|nr:protein claret segregational [Anopheles maculipalpis]